jgi:hypothetical protein
VVTLNSFLRERSFWHSFNESRSRVPEFIFI